MRVRALAAALPHSLRRRIRSGRELIRERRDTPAAAPLVTHVSALDGLLGGGLPPGRLVELVGRRSSGRFSIVLSTLVAATVGGEAAALVDLGDNLDPQTAARSGADLERILWLRPRTTRQALAATEMVLAVGFPLVVLDLGNPPLRGGRGAEASWMRLARGAKVHGTALLVTSPYRASGTAAAVVLTSRAGRPSWQGSGGPRLLAGLGIELQLEKSHARQRPGRTEPLRLTAVA